MPKGRRAKRERITIQRPVYEEGNYGQRKITGWQDVKSLTNLFADWDVIAGSETFRGQQVQADVGAVFSIREQPIALSTEYRLLHINTGKAWGIVGFRPAKGHYESSHRDTLIFVKAISE